MYQISDQVNTTRRPKRSATKPNATVPIHSPAKVAEHEGAKAGHRERLQGCEKAERFGLEQPRLDHAGRDIAGEEQIVELEHAAQRDQDHHGPDGA